MLLFLSNGKVTRVVSEFFYRQAMISTATVEWTLLLFSIDTRVVHDSPFRCMLLYANKSKHPLALEPPIVRAITTIKVHVHGPRQRQRLALQHPMQEAHTGTRAVHSLYLPRRACQRLQGLGFLAASVALARGGSGNTLLDGRRQVVSRQRASLARNVDLGVSEVVLVAPPLPPPPCCVAALARCKTAARASAGTESTHTAPPTS